MNRRTLIRTVGAGAVVGPMAGCMGEVDGGDSGDGDDGNGNGTQGGDGSAGEVTFRIGGSGLPDRNSLKSFHPLPMWEFSERLKEASGGSIKAEPVGQSQICGQGDCPEKVQSNVVSVVDTSLGNSTKSWPENNIWMLPYTFPSLSAMAYTFSKQESWERYWVPLAKKYGVFPIFVGTPQFRDILIGTDTYNQRGTLVTPDDISGLKIRRTFSKVAAVALSEWGANPINLAWGDTVEGLRSGVVDGVETYIGPALAFGMGESIGEFIVNNWGAGFSTFWVNIDWLKNLPDERLQTVIDVSKSLHTDSMRQAEQIYYEKIGVQNNPPEGSGLAEQDIEVRTLTDEELSAWKDPVDPTKHPDLYEEFFTAVTGLEGISDGREFHEYLWETAREAPESVEEFSIDAWWSDYLSEV